MKYMKTTLAALIASSLLGCEPTSPDQEVDSYIRQEAAKLATERQNLDKAELSKTLADLKQQDPKVKDVYYTMNSAGERELNIVRESDDVATNGSSGAETFTYALLGMGAAMWMMNNMNNSSSFNSVSSRPNASLYQQRAKSTFKGTREENEKRRTSGVATYVAATNSQISNNVYQRARNGSFRSTTGNSVSSSRPAFGGSGARSSSVGG